MMSMSMTSSNSEIAKLELELQAAKQTEKNLLAKIKLYERQIHTLKKDQDQLATLKLHAREEASEVAELKRSLQTAKSELKREESKRREGSIAPCTRTDVLQLVEFLDTKLQQRQARKTGICPIRRELYSQCFDELLRQVTIDCAEMGLLLLRVRNENEMTIAAYQTLYESSMAYSMRKALQAEEGKADMESRIVELENEKEDLKRELNEQKAKCDEIERSEAEKRHLEEKKHNEEIQLLKRNNQQLKAQLEWIGAPEK